MEDMLSQAEVDALLSGDTLETNNESQDNAGLSYDEIDAIGEIGNINMGNSATTLSTLLGHKVEITTPQVMVPTWEQVMSEYQASYVAVRVAYTTGLNGLNLLLLKEDDVRVITDLMMGGDGTNREGEITDLHLSAVSEAMNQMIGTAATSMSSMFDKRIDISPPKAFPFTEDSSESENYPDKESRVVRISFKMTIEGLLDSQFMQIIPLEFAKELVANIMNTGMGTGASEPEEIPESETPSIPQQDPDMQHSKQRTQGQHTQMESVGQARVHAPVNVQPAQFEAFDDGVISLEKKNIGLIMDVPLQVTVELGRTNKLIRDILEFNSGSIIELDKLAGDPVDILVNGKIIARGEVVVIDESFGVRITDIIDPSKRL
ncbi:MAG: flagellar motor switch phosphatase FliY [Clostridium sp.]|nr:flagellar motor switch phosphatase FliY [Clostridium sp.]